MLFDHRSVQINLLLLITRRFLWRHQALARSSCCLRTVEFDQNSLCNARLCFEAKTDRCRCVNKAGVEASPSPCVSADVLPLVPPVPKRFGGITRMVSAPKKKGSRHGLTASGCASSAARSYPVRSSSSCRGDLCRWHS